MGQFKTLILKHDKDFKLVRDERIVKTATEFDKLVKDTIAIGSSRLMTVADSELTVNGDTASIEFHLNDEGLLHNAPPMVAIMNEKHQLVQVYAGNMTVSKYDVESNSLVSLSDDDLELFYTHYKRAILPKNLTKQISDHHVMRYGGQPGEWGGKPVEVFVKIRKN